jgi:hypothetical protein
MSKKPIGADAVVVSDRHDDSATEHHAWDDRYVYFSFCPDPNRGDVDSFGVPCSEIFFFAPGGKEELETYRTYHGSGWWIYKYDLVYSPDEREY